MKVNFSAHEIKNIAETVEKHLETEVSTVSKHTENSKYVTSSLEAMATSARAFIDKKKADLLTRYADVIKLFESKEAVKGENVIRDIEILRKPGHLIDNYIPVFRSEQEAISKVKTGDVFQIQGRKTVAIKNKTGEVEQLSMDRDSYFELFPPVERFMNVQPESFGNCYEVTSLNAVMENPETRENLLRCIDTVSKKGMVRVKFPNGSKDGVSFSPNEIKKEGMKYFSKGCEGVRYVEHALGKEYERPFIEYIITELKNMGAMSEAKKIEQLYKWGQYDEIAKICGSKNRASLGTNLREAGDAIVPWRILGFQENASVEMGDYLSKAKDGPRWIEDRKWLDIYKDKTVITDSEELAKRIWSPEFFKTHLVEAYVGNSASTSPLYQWHSYRLAPILDKEGAIEAYALKNPHGVTDERIEFDNIFDMIDSISFAKIK